MIGIVIVSHSARLAEGVCELAAQVARGKVRLAAAGGTSEPSNPIGTDALKVLAAIEEVYSDDGVLVFTDLGSAVLSAETALDFLDEQKRARVRLSAASVVEGAVSAASLAAAGAPLPEIVAETQAGRSTAVPGGMESGALEEVVVTLPNRLGLHARPAARCIRLARGFSARVTIENLATGAAAVEIRGIHALLSLGARQGHSLRLRAQGPEARQALAALTDFLAAGCGDSEAAPPVLPAERAAAAEGQLAGIPASAGIAIGPLVQLRPEAAAGEVQAVADPEAERVRLLNAVRAAEEETVALSEWARKHAGESEAGIFEAQALYLQDPELLASAARRILEERVNAEFAWQKATKEFAASLAALEDAYLRARAADVADVAARVLRRLRGAEAGGPVVAEPGILAAHDLTPSEVKALDPGRVLGLCLETGSASAHSVILARAMGIPAVVGVGPGITALAGGTEVALDGAQGLVWISPGPDQVRRLEDRRTAWRAARAAAQAARLEPAATRDGRPIRVLANISSVAGAYEAVACGAQGVGVLRTEFLFLGRAAAPSEEDQLTAYRSIAEALAGRPLTIRTLDIGGDKSLPYVPVGAEPNPFLGWRGIRLTLSRSDLLRTQVRAIVRAASAHPVELLLPMISSLFELRAAKAVLAAAAAEVGLAEVRVGVMIEVPSAVAIADQLAREADFLSIGTNDLIQYVMAADRTNALVAAIADPFQPAVLRMIRQAIEAGKAAGKAVALCGELAADPLATPLLLGLGLEEFSLSAPFIPELKRAIRRWSLPEAEGIARQALELESCEAVRALLQAAGA